MKNNILKMLAGLTWGADAQTLRIAWPALLLLQKRNISPPAIRRRVASAPL